MSVLFSISSNPLGTSSSVIVMVPSDLFFLPNIPYTASLSFSNAVVTLSTIPATTGSPFIFSNNVPTAPTTSTTPFLMNSSALPRGPNTDTLPFLNSEKI